MSGMTLVELPSGDQICIHDLRYDDTAKDLNLENVYALKVDKFLDFAMDKRSLPLIKAALYKAKHKMSKDSLVDILEYMYAFNKAYQGTAFRSKKDIEFFSNAVKLAMSFFDGDTEQEQMLGVLKGKVEEFLLNEVISENGFILFRGEHLVDKKIEYIKGAIDFSRLKNVDWVEEAYLTGELLQDFQNLKLDRSLNMKLLSRGTELPPEVILKIFSYLPLTEGAKYLSLTEEDYYIPRIQTRLEQSLREEHFDRKYLELKRELMSREEPYRIAYKPQIDVFASAFVLREVIEGWPIFKYLYGNTLGSTIKSYLPSKLTDIKLPEFLSNDYLWITAHFAAGFISTLGLPVGTIGQFAIPLVSTALYSASLRAQEVLTPSNFDTGTTVFTKSALAIGLGALNTYNGLGAKAAIMYSLLDGLTTAANYLNSYEQADESAIERSSGAFKNAPSFLLKLLALEETLRATLKVYKYHSDIAFTLKNAMASFKVAVLLDSLVEIRAKMHNPNSLTSEKVNDVKDAIKYCLYKAGISSYGIESLPKAAKTGDLKLIKSLIDQGAEGKDDVLSEAITKGNYRVIELLIDEGAQLNTQSLNALIQPWNFYAAKLTLGRISSKLLDYNPDNMKDQLLKGATYMGDSRLVKWLAENGSNSKLKALGDALQQSVMVNLKDKLLEEASYIGNLELVKWLIENGANPKAAALNNALSEKQFEVAKLLIEKGAPITDSTLDVIKKSKGFSEFMARLKDVSKALAEEGVGPYIGLFLLSAVYEEDMELAKLLVKNGAEVITKALIGDIFEGGIHTMQAKLTMNPYNVEFLHRVAINGESELVSLPADQGAEGKDYALTKAIINEAYEAIELLINEGAQLNAQSLNALAQSGSFYAAKFTIGKVSNKLLGYDLDDMKDKLLTGATYMGNARLVKWLAENSSNSKFKALGDALQQSVMVSLKDKLLEEASYIGNLELVKWLIEDGANPKAAALNNALSEKQFEVAKLLIEKGAPITDSTLDVIKNSEGFSEFVGRLKSASEALAEEGMYTYSGLFLSSAIYGKDMELAKLLVKNGAKVITKILSSDIFEGVDEENPGYSVMQISEEVNEYPYLDSTYEKDDFADAEANEEVGEEGVGYCPVIPIDESICENEYL